MIAEVDCTVDKELCGDYEVSSYPTLLYGEPLAPDKYSGSRDLESLKEFAKENLQPYCSIYTIDACSDEEKKAIKELQEKPVHELLAEDERVENILEAAQEEFEKDMEEMDKKYNEMVEKFNEKMDEIRADTNYRYIQQILYERNEDSEEEEDGTEAEL